MPADPRSCPPLIPQPADYQPAPGAFAIDAATAIVVGPHAGDATRFAARQLAEAIREATGLDLPLRHPDDVTPGGRAITLGLRERDAVPPGATLVARGPEGYELVVAPGAIAVTANAEAGLFYGVQTLRQLLRTQGRILPACAIGDQPALPHRGVMLDVSRGKVPTLETLLALVDTLAAYKYNQFQLYTEHTFAFPSHPDIGAGCDPLTAQDMLALDRHCRERHIELVPNLQSCGHQRALLSLPEYAHLDELGWRWTVTPAREETYHLFADLYADLLPNFTSGWLNVNSDETWDLGWGQSKPLADRDGTGAVYLRHILRLRELAAAHGHRIMLWADVLHHHPAQLPALPDDVLLLDWAYEAAEHYPTIDALAGSQRQFFVCPGTSTWNTLFPRIDNALANIRNYVRDGLAGGASGMLLTDWGDHGHYQLLSLSLYPYLFGAATAWTGAATAPEDFDRAFAPLAFGLPAGSAAVAALRRLGRAVTGPTLGLPNRSNSARALFDDPLNGSLIARASPAALAELRDAALDACRAWAALPDAALRHDYTFTARQIAFAAGKVLGSQALRQTLRALPDEGDRAPWLTQLDEAIEALRRVHAAIPALAAEFAARWLREARPSEIDRTLRHYQAVEDRCVAALVWLDEQRDRYVGGAAPDREAHSYHPDPFLVLWDEDEERHAELRRLIAAARATSPTTAARR